MIKIKMDGIEVLPNVSIESEGAISREFLARGVSEMHAACHWVKDLLYGYNSSHEDSLIIFREEQGVCYTKHGAIARLAEETGVGIHKYYGFYRLNDEIITGVDAVVGRHGMQYIPQVHCFLEYRGRYVDLTEGNCNGKNKSIDTYDFVVQTAADLSDQERIDLYVEYLQEYFRLEPKLAAIGSDKLLKILSEVNQVAEYQCSIVQ